MDVVFHLSTADEHDHSRATNNVRNLLEDETVDADSVALVANGGGVDALLDDSSVARYVESLLDRGVVFYACGNTLASNHIDASRLIDGVEHASSGVGTLAALQARGYGYIKVP